MSGEFDYLLQVMVPDLEDYGEFALKALLRMPGVKDTRSSLAMSRAEAVCAAGVAIAAPPAPYPRSYLRNR